MANKSSKSPSGEEREQSSEYKRDHEVEKKDVKGNDAGLPSSTQLQPEQENQKNRGYQEDQPHNPVRSSGSMKKDQESLPTGEPDPGEV